MEPHAKYVFETSWEVCNKVGGIYTVVKSKSSAMQDAYDNYCMIGPYKADKAETGFEARETPDFLQDAFNTLEDLGVTCHYGVWLVEEEPNTILLETPNMEIDLDTVKSDLYDQYGVDSISAGYDFDEPLTWSWAVAKLMEALCLEDTVLHCHEWMAGFPILYLNDRCPNIKTVFTTHATMLGRTMAGSGRNLYDELDDIDPEHEARQLGVSEKFTTERACAHTADVFTTVSEITAIEAEKILDKEVDVILNNGMNTDAFPTIEDTTLMHVKNRDHVRDFLTYFFFPYYSFPLEHNLIYYIAGRFEYSNKGFDVLVDALGKLNERMKKDKDDDRTVTVFFFTPLANRGIKQSVEENRHYYNHIKDHLEKHTDDIMDKLLLDVISQQCSMEESIFTNDYLKEVKQKLKLFQREGNPPISTHDIADREENPLLQNLLDNGLDNHRDDPVKVIVYPVYLDGDDGLLDLQYYDALSAGHFGLYPSYYEPWGYTPVESMSLGVPALTTDLAGFGRFIKPKTLDENPGIYILDRYDNTTDEVVDQLYEIMYDFAQNDHAERVQNKINAKQMSMLTDWEHFVKNYIEAHNKALDA